MLPSYRSQSIDLRYSQVTDFYLSVTHLYMPDMG